MKNTYKYINKQIKQNNIILKRAATIKQEIYTNKKYNLYDDHFILL